MSAELIILGVASAAALVGVPAAIYATVVSRQTKRIADIGQLITDLTGNDAFCLKITNAVVYSDKHRDRVRELLTDRLQYLINERHLVGGGEDREFKDNLRREMDDLKNAINGLRSEVRLVLRRTDTTEP